MNTLYSSFVNINKIKATALFEDRLKNLWIGCAYQGMLMLPHKDMPFHFYDLPITLSDTPGQINAIYNDRQNVLWCAIEDNGIFQFDSHGHVTRNIPTPGSVSSMYEDSEGTFWIGVNEKGLYIMDRKTGTLHLQYPVSGDFAIRTIAEDRHKNLYISILGKGILRYQLRTRKGELFSVGHPLPGKKIYIIIGLLLYSVTPKTESGSVIMDISVVTIPRPDTFWISLSNQTSNSRPAIP